jgi:hypothetical protein
MLKTQAKKPSALALGSSACLKYPEISILEDT